MKHGKERYFIKGNGWIVGTLIPLSTIGKVFKKYCLGFPFPKPDPIDPDPDDPPAKPRRIFCRLFGEGVQPDAEALIELGMAMEIEEKDNISTQKM